MRISTMKNINLKPVSIQEELNKRILDNYFRLLSEANDDKSNDTDDKKENDTDDKDIEAAGIDKGEFEKHLSGLDDTQKTKFKKVCAFLGKMLNSASDSLIASNLDDFTLGNFKEAVCEIYKKQKLSKMSESDLEKEAETLHNSPGYDKADKKSKLSSRKDDNTNTEIDEKSTTYKCMFWSKNPQENLLKQLETLTIEIQKKAKSLSDSKNELKSEIKSKKIEGVSDGEIDAFGPMIKQMIDAGKSPEEISKKVSEMKTGVKESYDRKIRKYTNHKLLTEGKCIITEKQKNVFLMESLVESDEFIDSMTQYLINEGLFDGIKKMAKATGKLAKKAVKSGAELAKAAWSKVPEKYRNMIKDLSEKALEKLKDGALAPILSIAGIGVMVVSGAWGIALILACMTLISKHGKYIKASFDKHWDAFKNSKGVITQMDFNIKNNPDLKYSLRYYIIDQTWRVLNLRNQSQTPSLNFSKAIIKSAIGQKFIKEIIKKWDPVFNKDKGGKIDFKDLLSQSKTLNINDKQLKLLSDFKLQYPKTITSMTKPAIDTRAVSMSDLKKK